MWILFKNKIVNNDLFSKQEFKIKDYIKDNEEKDNEDFHLFKNDTEGNDQTNDFYVTKNQTNLKVSDFHPKTYETSREHRRKDLDGKKNARVSDFSNPKDKSTERDSAKKKDTKSNKQTSGKYFG